MATDFRIAVIGLGYVGLPLAIALARHYRIVGFDIDAGRIAQLKTGDDRTREILPGKLKNSKARFTDKTDDIKGCDVFVVTVPTPVDAHNVPDLGAVRAACEIVGGALETGAVVVFESTVYPGVTEDICGPALEAASGLVCGRDFFLGYSPERINPGDTEHTVDKITKVVAGQTEEVTKLLSEIYGRVTTGGAFVAANIRTAEAAKVIENAQRDINIAFINEVATIFQKMGLSIDDVLEAAGTKWNFLNFTPGLVGGHCIGVDPYYLAHAAVSIGHHPEIILAGRRINDSMGGYVAECIVRELARTGLGAGARVLVLGLTFKENVPDLRNTKVVDIIAALRNRGLDVSVHDPLADAADAARLYDISLLPDLDGAAGFNCVVGAVPHDAYRDFTTDRFRDLLCSGGLIADVKGMWRSAEIPEDCHRWQL